jgi:tetratricopeptide (TPR) repeat protein
LQNPNENTIAQAQWAVDKIGDLPIDYRAMNSFEASFYRNMHLENWEKSFDESLNWLVDQPFSIEPIKHASYLSTVVSEETDLSIKICDFGLRLNPVEFALLNNKSYSLAISKKSAEAEKIFKQIGYASLKEIEKVTYTATKGLIYYSRGEISVGKKFYGEAEQMASKLRNETLAFRVKAYKIRAELIFGEKSEAMKVVESLVFDSNKYRNAGIKKVINNILKRIIDENKNDQFKDKM